jgi:RNA polymerase sigma-70 factor (ECF subfamily)
LELVEDAVQMALWRALQNWSRQGIPDAPAAWLFRTARNLAIDALRRETHFQKVREAVSSSVDYEASPNIDIDAPIADDTLRLLFLCCHPAIAPESQIALALKLVGGFGIEEIASGLLSSTSNIEKRITRAKSKLREVGEEIAALTGDCMQARLDAVLHVLYLVFNEGFSASRGESAIKRDVCDEAIRLVRMLSVHPLFAQQPVVAALLALMLMHSARFVTRVDVDECIVLLADQDRSAWDWARVREAMHWMLAAARGEELSRYHIEVAIVWEHCRSVTLAATDWQRVTELYQLLMRVAPSPMVRLNTIIAQSYSLSLSSAIEQLLAMPDTDRKQLRPWWDCTMAQLLERHGEPQRARSYWQDALALAGSSASRKLIEKRLNA